jgi:hypothetical protein
MLLEPSNDCCPGDILKTVIIKTYPIKGKEIFLTIIGLKEAEKFIETV